MQNDVQQNNAEVLSAFFAGFNGQTEYVEQVLAGLAGLADEYRLHGVVHVQGQQGRPDMLDLHLIHQDGVASMILSVVCPF